MKSFASQIRRESMCECRFTPHNIARTADEHQIQCFVFENLKQNFTTIDQSFCEQSIIVTNHK